MASNPDPLDPVASDGSPAQAFATHRARGNGIARFFALTRLLKDIPSQQAGEDNVHTLIAHFHMLSIEPGFAPPGQEPSATAAPAALRRLNRGNGLVGTKGASTERDYDMALKGLMILLYRYRAQLGPDLIDFIMRELIPDHMVGGHSPSVEIVEQSFLNLDTPETENHLLMIESSRYLNNQLKHDETPDPKFDNKANGLQAWLLGFMQTFLRHDFLEFNSRPYQRLALHPMLNLHEFARDPAMKRAAQMVLDYVMMKFALSSSRGRRVPPFRRLQHRINHQANIRNYLYSEQADQVEGFFQAYTGQLGGDGKPARFPDSLADNGLLSGLAPYRPPPAAYILAMRQDNPPSLHRFYHGARPMLPEGEQADPGLEIYNHSPSFLISAGGSFLNSGYGSDEVDLFSKQAWEQTSRAQATTIISMRAEAAFCDLVRFEPYPDPRVDPYNDDPKDPDTHHTRGVNYGVVRNFAAGANMRPAEHKTVLEESTSAAPALAFHNGAMFGAWKGSGNDNLNVARVQGTALMGIDGVEGTEQKTILAESSDTSPAIASHGGRLFLAWKGSGNDQLNIAVSTNDGHSFVGKKILGEESEFAPALASYNGHLYIAWTGLDENLNVARVTVFANTAGGAGVEGIEGKVTLGETSKAAPALCSHNGRLFLTWKGSGNDDLNLAFSSDGAGFGGKRIFAETSSHGPSLASHGGRLFFSWKGSGNENLNVARITLIGNTAGAFSIDGMEGKVTLGEISEEPPTIASGNDLLFLGWKGEADDNLDFRVSRDGSFGPVGPWIFADRSNLGYYLAAFRAPPTHPDQLIEPLDSLGFAYIVEKQDMDARGMSFEDFKQHVFRANINLPATLDYGGHYTFKTIDGREIAIWFEFVEQKYTPRVVDISEPVTDFGTLPLISGEYMRAPGGHDGLIEIRQPGCEAAPMTLDYRDAANPFRDENRAGCSAPWIERMFASFDASRRFLTEGRISDARDARTEASGIYDDMLRLNPEVIGPKLAPTVIDALAAMGIDFSVPKADLKDWLANPQFTPYPALAQALLTLGVNLKAPVFIDVIAFNYENSPDVASPRKLIDVRVDILKAAIIEGWNVRYGVNIRMDQFDLILG